MKQGISDLWLKLKKFMERKDAAEWTMVFLTFAIVAFTLASTYFTCRQIDIYEETTVDDLRAYLAIQSITPARLIVGQKHMVVIVFKNVGKTTAYNVRHRSIWVKCPIPYRGLVDTLNRAPFARQFSMSPGAEDRLEATSDVISPQDSIDIFWFKQSVCVLGEFQFVDKFDRPRYVHYAVGVNTWKNQMFVLDFFNDESK